MKTFKKDSFKILSLLHKEQTFLFCINKENKKIFFRLSEKANLENFYLPFSKKNKALTHSFFEITFEGQVAYFFKKISSFPFEKKDFFFFDLEFDVSKNEICLIYIYRIVGTRAEEKVLCNLEEKELLKEFLLFFLKEKPLFIIGYNHVFYDNTKIFLALKKYNLTFCIGPLVFLKEDFDFVFFHFDLYSYFKATGERLCSLNEVSKKYLKKEKNKIDFSKFSELLVTDKEKVIEYCKKDVLLVVELFFKKKLFKKREELYSNFTCPFLLPLTNLYEVYLAQKILTSAVFPQEYLAFLTLKNKPNEKQVLKLQEQQVSFYPSTIRENVFFLKKEFIKKEFSLKQGKNLLPLFKKLLKTGYPFPVLELLDLNKISSKIGPFYYFKQFFFFMSSIKNLSFFYLTKEKTAFWKKNQFFEFSSPFFFRMENCQLFRELEERLFKQIFLKKRKQEILRELSKLVFSEKDVSKFEFSKLIDSNKTKLKLMKYPFTNKRYEQFKIGTNLRWYKYFQEKTLVFELLQDKAPLRNRFFYLFSASKFLEKVY